MVNIRRHAHFIDASSEKKREKQRKRPTIHHDMKCETYGDICRSKKNHFLLRVKKNQRFIWRCVNIFEINLRSKLNRTFSFRFLIFSFSLFLFFLILLLTVSFENNWCFTPIWLTDLKRLYDSLFEIFDSIFQVNCG